MKIAIGRPSGVVDQYVAIVARATRISAKTAPEARFAKTALRDTEFCSGIPHMAIA